jgi:hypothetical protein
MLKAKPIKIKTKKAPKAKKAKKTYIKPASSTVQHYQASHYQNKQIHSQGFFNPFAHNTGVATSSSSSIPHYTSSGGIPYTSIFESYGITNRPPYFLESYILKTTEPNYQKPTPSQTSTTKTGSNPMSKPKTNTFETQTKSETVNYVDLVAPKKKGDETTQPDYITLQPETTGKTMKEKLIERAEYRKKNEIPEDVKVSPIMKKEEKKTEKIKESLKERKRLRGKKNEEL